MPHRARRLAASMHDAGLQYRLYPARLRLLDTNTDRRLLDGDGVQLAHQRFDLGEFHAAPVQLAGIYELVLLTPGQVESVKPVVLLARVTGHIEGLAVLAWHLDPVVSPTGAIG